MSASWGLSRRTQPLLQVVTSRQYCRRGFGLDVVVEVLSKVDNMAAKAGVIADVDSKVVTVGGRYELAGRRVDEPCKGVSDLGRHYPPRAVDLLELELDRPIAMEGSQRLLATLPEAGLEDIAVRAVLKLELEVQSISRMAQISEDQRDEVAKRSYLNR